MRLNSPSEFWQRKISSVKRSGWWRWLAAPAHSIQLNGMKLKFNVKKINEYHRKNINRAKEEEGERERVGEKLIKCVRTCILIVFLYRYRSVCEDMRIFVHRFLCWSWSPGRFLHFNADSYDWYGGKFIIPFGGAGPFCDCKNSRMCGRFEYFCSALISWNCGKYVFFKIKYNSPG